MTHTGVSAVTVFFMLGDEKIQMGRLALKDRKIYFEYDPLFLKSNLSLSPFQLPLKAGLIACEDRLFEGIFGIFNDSLPDGWGRLLLDRKLATLGIHAGKLSPLDRLCYVGHHGMGALMYEPEMEAAKAVIHHHLDVIAQETLQFLEHDEDKFIDDLLLMNGSSAGARPKILVSLLDGSFVASDVSRRPCENHWIIKFRSSLDPKDSGPIEFAYHLMAKAAGLDVPEAQLFKSKIGPGHFGVRRFDRVNGQRVHMHTLSGLLHLDHRVPSLDYETLIKITWRLCQDTREMEKQFRAAVFNLFTHNRDDHAKNFSFVMDEKGTWRVSPAYDLTYSYGPAGEHCTMYMGEGKSPQVDHLLKLAHAAELSNERAKEIIETVLHAASQWKLFAQEAGVTIKSRDNIQAAILTGFMRKT